MAGSARTDLKRADREITAGPCFDELDLDVVHVVFEVKRSALAVAYLRLRLGPRGDGVIVAIQLDESRLSVYASPLLC
jgi:hypothetical protein